MRIGLSRLGLFASAVIATAAALSSSAHAAVTPADQFTFSIAGFNSASGTGYILGSGILTTFGAPHTFTAAGYNGQDYTINSYEVVGPTTTTDYFKISTPTNFLTTTTVSGTTITALQLDIGTANSGVGVGSGANPVNLANAISSYTVTGNMVYGTANTVFTLTPTVGLATGGLSFTAAEGVNTGTSAISSFAVHEFDFSITYANPAVVTTATTTTITNTLPLQSTYGDGYSIAVAAAAATGSTQPTTGTVTCTLQPQPSGTATTIGPVSINAGDGTAQCPVPTTQAAGTYNVIATYGGSTDGAFTSSSSDAAMFTIAPAALTITPTDGQTKVYGTSDPAVFAYTYSGLIGTSTLSGALGRAPGENVGSYAYNLGNLTVSDAGNYTMSLAVGNTFAITPEMTSVALSSPCSSVFVGGGNEPYSLTAAVSPANVSGTVTFEVNGAAVCSDYPLSAGSATCIVNDLDVQSGDSIDELQFSAAYSGDGNTSASSTTSAALVISAGEAIMRNGFEEIVAGCPIE